jgi:hypothetical protein
VTIALAAVLALAAGWCVCHRIGRHLQRAAATAERLTGPIPDPAPIPDRQQLSEQAAIDETFDDMISHWNEDVA